MDDNLAEVPVEPQSIAGPGNPTITVDMAQLWRGSDGGMRFTCRMAKLRA